MKLLKLTIVIYSLTIIGMNAQGINGVYSTKFTYFNNPNDSSKDFSDICDDYILIDVFELNELSGSITISGKGDTGESTSMKFVVYGEKKVDYIDGYTDINYSAKISLANIEIKEGFFQLNYTFNSEEKFFTVTYPNGAYQVWFIKNKL